MVVGVLPVYRGELSSVLRLDVFVACQRVVRRVVTVYIHYTVS
jgi:hypothetical protein